MTTFPLDLVGRLGHWESYIVYLLIGFAFGFVLEIAGFGNSRKLAAQFYFKDMTVLKVMFTAIIVAMALIFLTTGLKVLDYDMVYVNHTYLWPGIVGGLIMGVGFIVGGFCPGTSLVAAATLKLDGIVFALGVFFGIFVFGESVSTFESFWTSSYEGRYTLMDLLGLDTGVIVLGIIVMALAVFWGAEQLERIVGKQDLTKAPRWRYGAAGALVALAVAVLVIGQPSGEIEALAVQDEGEQIQALTDREVQIHPGELLSLIDNPDLTVVMLDLRDAHDYDLFHIAGADNVTLDALPGMSADFIEQAENTVFVTISNDERAATDAWKVLSTAGVPHTYILSGGVNAWIAVFADEVFLADHPRSDEAGDDQLAYEFFGALGADAALAHPDASGLAGLEYDKKVDIEIKKAPAGGGCG